MPANNRSSRLEKARQRHPSVTCKTPNNTPRAAAAACNSNHHNEGRDHAMDLEDQDTSELTPLTSKSEFAATTNAERTTANTMTPSSGTGTCHTPAGEDGKQIDHNRTNHDNRRNNGDNYRATESYSTLQIHHDEVPSSQQHTFTTGIPKSLKIDTTMDDRVSKTEPISHGRPSPTTITGRASSPKPSPFPRVPWPSTKLLRTNDLPAEPNARGIYSPWAWLWGCIFAIVPVAYVYIGLVVLRELTLVWPELQRLIAELLPYLATFLQHFKTHSSRWVEAWCVLEAAFYLALKLHMRYLDHIDPLEASLSSAPLMDPEQRQVLWQRMMEAERQDAAGWISAWFFDQDIGAISRKDVRAFCTWSMFEGRNFEHLTLEEVEQLEDMIQQLEHCISLQWYGVKPPQQQPDSDADAVAANKQGGPEQQPSFLDNNNNNKTDDTAVKRMLEGRLDETVTIGGEPACTTSRTSSPRKRFVNDSSFSRQAAGAVGNRKQRLPVPNQLFRFPEHEQDSPPDFFSNLYESYRRSYEKYRAMIADKTPGNFRPVEDFWNFMATTQQNIVAAEENAMAAATQTAENAMATATETATHMYERIVPPGSNMDKQLHAIGQATHTQLEQAFHSLHSLQKGMTERLETAKFLSTQRRALRKQIKGYREMLQRLRASAVPPRQMAVLMRRITESTEALDRLEGRARDAFVKATGYARKNLLFPTTEPQRFAKYSSDPLLGVATYPLGFHLLILGATEIPLRVLLGRRGFEKRSIGPISYYFHPGSVDEYDDDDEDDEDRNNTPIVFVHGIGIGLISYLPLIEQLLKLGRPVFLPEVPYVSSFRPWLGPYAVLPPASVCSTLTAMLATHGFLRGTFVGHSYGTSWLSYMVQHAPTAVAAVLFLDPICFCLHVPRLTKKFVYHRPDPGKIEYIVRTDLIVNWTIQRSFPWSWISLFAEQIQVPCSVFLSGCDALVPAQKVEEYFRSKGEPVADFKPGMDSSHFFKGDKLNACIFRGHGHGDWTDYPIETVPVIVEAVQVLCSRAEDSGR